MKDGCCATLDLKVLEGGRCSATHQGFGVEGPRGLLGINKW
jgi:hypothetical protein